MKEEFTSRESSSIVVPALVSGLVGAGLALLFAPKTGSEIRHDIGQLAKKTAGKAAEVIEEGKAAVSEAVQTGEESFAEAKEQLSLAEPVSDERSLLVPILVSGVIGAAVGLLFAPKPGKEVMGDLKDFASSAIEKGKVWYEQGSSALKEALEKGKEAAVEEKEKLRPAA